jgi:glycosyltransferase involved in cell wall biosynthesis
LKILFFPDFDQNQYTENIYRIIESIEGVNLTRVNGLPFNLMKQGYHHYDFVIVSWLENWLTDAKTHKLSLRTVLRFLLRVIMLKFIGKKLIYIRHNIYPHALDSRYGKLAAKLTDFACWLSDFTVVHSGHLDSGYQYIPHPLYRFEQMLNDAELTSNNFFVVFGRIIEYKAIDKLLSIWDSVPLLVTGSVGSQKYVEHLHLLKECRNLANVTIDARFLSNNEAQAIVSSSRGLILAHSEDDMIVSGSFFFAASLGVPVYALKSPFLTWLKSEFNYTGLRVFDDLQGMVNAIQTDQDLIDRKQISAEAKQLFGDYAIKQAMEKLILGMN